MADHPDNQSQNAEDEQPRAEAAPSKSDANAANAGGASASSADDEPTAEQSLEAAAKAAEAIKRETSDEDQSSDQPAAKGATLDLPAFDSPATNGVAKNADLGMLNDIDLNVRVELGRTRMYIEDVLRLNENSIVELDKAAGDPVDIYVNDRHVARGEVLVLSENFCVRVSEIIQQPEEDEA